MYDPIRQLCDCLRISDSGGAMKRDDLLKIASEIFDYKFRENTPQFARIEQLAKRIAAHEREECAKLCEDNDHLVNASHLAHTIRARSE